MEVQRRYWRARSGHARSRFSCKSSPLVVPDVPARALVCPSWCTRLVPAERCLFLQQATGERRTIPAMLCLGIARRLVVVSPLVRVRLSASASPPGSAAASARTDVPLAGWLARPGWRRSRGPPLRRMRGRFPRRLGAGEDAGAGCDRREDRDADRAADLVTGGVEA